MNQTNLSPLTVTINPVIHPDAQSLEPNSKSSVLLIGDSFTNIFSAEPMGWGTSAGLAERLSFHLKHRIDWIARNDNGAYATRKFLAEELNRGRDRLTGKRVIVWQFAMRELAVGNWKDIDMDVPTRPTPPEDAPVFMALAPGKSQGIRGVVKAAAPAPIPGTVPYKDHIIAVHLVNVHDDQGRPMEANSALIYIWSMRNNVRTEATRLIPGKTITIQVRPWSDVERKLGSINRRDLEDETLLLAEPCWAEELRK